MKINLAIFAGLFFVLIMAGIVSAVEDVATTSTSQGLFGQCVSQNALVKNSCFNVTKQTFMNCKASAPDDDTRKDVLKQCRLTYKAEKKQCKLAFKTAKQECKKNKENPTKVE